MSWRQSSICRGSDLCCIMYVAVIAITLTDGQILRIDWDTQTSGNCTVCWSRSATPDKE